MGTIRSVNYGGGVQSTALLILAAEGRIDFPLFIFANTGDDSEDPLALEYVHEVAMPFAARHGIEMVEVQQTFHGEPDSILGRIMRTPKAEVIPVRSKREGVPLSRSCTVDFKIKAVGAELKRRGAGPDNRATVALGISSDESSRAGRAEMPWEHLAYPLLGIGCDLPDGWDRPLRRNDCEGIIRRSELPTPPKSACWFCPNTSMGRWMDMRRDRPELFARACGVEQHIAQKAGSPRYLTRFGRPLAEVVTDGDALFDLDDTERYSCTGGMCFT